MIHKQKEIDSWIDGWMDEWIAECMDRQIDIQTMDALQVYNIFSNINL